MSQRCSRCGKPLSNPKSIKEGMGPICRAKAKKEFEEKCYDKGPREENDYTTLTDYLSKLNNPKCIGCQADLNQHGEVDHLMHDGGYNLKNYKYPQWILFKCLKCGRESSFSHLLNHYGQTSLINYMQQQEDANQIKI